MCFSLSLLLVVYGCLLYGETCFVAFYVSIESSYVFGSRFNLYALVTGKDYLVQIVGQIEAFGIVYRIGC
jgi:uncharacterized protein YuzB (UPF0349 family)